MYYHAFLFPSSLRIFVCLFFLLLLSLISLVPEISLLFLPSDLNPNPFLKSLFIYYCEIKKMHVCASGHRVGCGHFSRTTKLQCMLTSDLWPVVSVTNLFLYRHEDNDQQSENLLLTIEKWDLLLLQKQQFSLENVKSQHLKWS